MSDFFEDYLRDYMKNHKVVTTLCLVFLCCLIAAAIGTAAFGWDIPKMVSNAGQAFSEWVYSPLDRSFDDLKDYVGQW